MTKDGWRDAIVKCVRQADSGDLEFLDSMAEMCAQFDLVSNKMRKFGFRMREFLESPNIVIRYETPEPEPPIAPGG